MKFIGKKIYIILLLLALIFQGSELLAKDTTIQYTKENISNYFLGIISLKKNYNDKAIKHLKKIESLKNYHAQYNVELLKTLVLLEQFEKAFSFSKNVSTEAWIFSFAPFRDAYSSLESQTEKSQSKAAKISDKASAQCPPPIINTCGIGIITSSERVTLPPQRLSRGITS